MATRLGISCLGGGWCFNVDVRFVQLDALGGSGGDCSLSRFIASFADLKSAQSMVSNTHPLRLSVALVRSIPQMTLGTVSSLSAGCKY